MLAANPQGRDRIADRLGILLTRLIIKDHVKGLTSDLSWVGDEARLELRPSTKNQSQAQAARLVVRGINHPISSRFSPIPTGIRNNPPLTPPHPSSAPLARGGRVDEIEFIMVREMRNSAGAGSTSAASIDGNGVDSSSSRGPSTTRRSSGRVAAKQTSAHPIRDGEDDEEESEAESPNQEEDSEDGVYAPSPVKKGRSLRPRNSRAKYALDIISEDDDDEEEDDDDDESDESDDDQEDGENGRESKNPPERISSAGHSLRPRATLAAPTIYKDYLTNGEALGEQKRSKRRGKGPGKNETKRKGKSKVKTSKGKSGVKSDIHSGLSCDRCKKLHKHCDQVTPKCSNCVHSRSGCKYTTRDSDDDEEEEESSEEYQSLTTVRSQIRKGIEETKKRKDAFLVKHHTLFEPLLPERNYITKLVDKLEKISTAEEEKNVEEDDMQDDLDIPEQDKSKKKAKAKPASDLVDIVPMELLKEQPEGVTTATMKSYQIAGLSFLLYMYNNGASAILGDEMGLGKTLQTLSLFSYLTLNRPCPRNHHRPFLVVCPLSVVSSWVAECKKWTPHLRVLRFHGPQAERDRLKRAAESGEPIGFEEKDWKPGQAYNVVVTSYEIFEREKQWFRRAFVWRYVVLDEGHKIKNDKSLISIALQGLQAEFRLILTGTPLQNNLTELWALFHWLYPEVFSANTSKKFEDAFDLTLGKNNLEFMDSARKLLELIMLRRMKESRGVNLGLPKKTEVVLYLPLVPMQRFWYKRLLTRLDKGLLDGVFMLRNPEAKYIEAADDAEKQLMVENKSVQNGDTPADELEDIGEQWGITKEMVNKVMEGGEKANGQWRKLMNLLMQLRKCCSHPYLLPNAEPEPIENGPHVILASSKMILLDKLIEELCIKQGKKVLVFSSFTRMLDICEDLLMLKGGDGSRFRYGRLDGGTARARRNLAIRLFNGNPDYKVMLISTRAGGLGINLASASDVVMLESDWNPQADLQAQARAHRIGQTQPVTVYRLIMQGTVEEQMMGRIRKKLYLSAKVTESMRDIYGSTSSAGLNKDAEQDMPNLSTGELMSLVRSGSRAIARQEIDPTEMLNWDWETMIKKCREYEIELENSAADAKDAAEEERKWLSEMERVQTRVFEGKRHHKGPESNKTISAEWNKEARRLGMERVVMVDGHPVLKETIGNGEWEAVKTLAGTNSRFADPPKKKRRVMQHQDGDKCCLQCYGGGSVHTCSGCPRVYHFDCLTPEFQAKTQSKMGQFYCPQHQCVECEQKTGNAGGMLFRCRWCPSAYCEDCLDFDNTDLLGENLLEFENLGVTAIEQAYYIKCPTCKVIEESDPEILALRQSMVKEWEIEASLLRKKYEDLIDSAETDVTTVENSEVATPAFEAAPAAGNSMRGAKRAALEATKKHAEAEVDIRPQDDQGVYDPKPPKPEASNERKKSVKVPGQLQMQYPMPIMHCAPPVPPQFQAAPPQFPLSMMPVAPRTAPMPVAPRAVPTPVAPKAAPLPMAPRNTVMPPSHGTPIMPAMLGVAPPAHGTQGVLVPVRGGNLVIGIKRDSAHVGAAGEGSSRKPKKSKKEVVVIDLSD
ncbi:hypothetical protein RUND412_001645 [Rhizina undulata]